MTSQQLALTIFVCALALAACGAPAATPAGLPAAPATGDSAPDRLIIKNAELAMVVDDPPSAADTITRLAETSGGFVVSVNTYQTTFDGQQAQTAEMVLRVPSAALNDVLSQIKSMAVEIRRETISGQDVTAEYVDLQSRLKNLESKEAQLQAIMDQADDTEDVLKVYEEFSRAREEIEVIRGQMTYFEQAAAMSAIRLDLLPNAAARPIEVGGWRPALVARNSLELLVRIAQSLADIAIGFTIVCGPFVLLAALPTLLFIRWRRTRAQANEPVEPAQP